MADNQVELREATKNLRLATEELQRFNQSAGYEIAQIVGKDVGGIASKFTAGFAQVPGVQTLGAIGKTLFNRAFAAMKEKRELKLIQDRLGINDAAMEEFKKTKKLNDAQEKLNKQFKDGAESLLGVEVKFDKVMEKTKVAFNEANNNFSVSQTAVTDGMERTTESIKDLHDGNLALQDVLRVRQQETSQFNDKLVEQIKRDGVNKEKGAELDKETNKLLSTIGRSQQDMVDNQSAMLNADVTGKAKQKEIANEETRANKRQENVFKRIAGSLGFLQDSAEDGDGEKKGFFGSLISKIGGFATQILALPAIFVTLKASLVAFGAALAPLAIPIALGAAALLGFVAFIKGFIEGFGEGGFFGGVKEGLMELFDWFVGFPLRLLKDLTTFVLRFLGFDALADDIDAAFEPFLAALRGIFGILSDVITVPIVAVGRTITGIFEGLFDMLMAPINGILTALTGVFDGIGKIIDGISMIFSGDIMGGLQMIFDGVMTSIVGVIDGVVVFVTELFGGFFDILLSPFRAIYNTLGDLFFNETSHVARIVAWISETFGGFFELITRPFRGIYDLVVGIFTFDLEQIGDGIFKLISGVFGIITSPFRAIFDLISSIFDFDFLGYLETLPGFKQVMGVIRGVKGFFTSDEEKDKARENLDAAVSEKIDARQDLRRAQKFEESVRSGNFTVNGQEATEEQRAELLAKMQNRTLAAEMRFADADLAAAEADELFRQEIEKSTLPDIVDAAGEKITSAYANAENKLMNFLGFGEDPQDLDQQISAQEKLVASLQKDVANERFFESDAQIEADKLALVEAMKELEDMKLLANQTNIINNNNVVTTNSSSSNQTVTTVPIKDTSPPAGTVPVM